VCTIKQSLSINPLTYISSSSSSSPSSSQTFVLTGIGNYDKINGTPDDNGLITLRLENTGDGGSDDGDPTEKGLDYYIGFNSNKAPNSGTTMDANLVLITEKEGPVNFSGL